MSALPPLSTPLTGIDCEIEEWVLGLVLEPYKPRCRYLQQARIQAQPSPGPLAAARGRFAIPESCYIADTGHFNAVEFNICYNQIAYCLMAECLHQGLLRAFAGWDLAQFSRRQLSHFLIVQFQSAFRKPIRTSEFYGQVVFEKLSLRRQTFFLQTTCRFDDEHGGTAEGGALIAILTHEG